MVVEEKDSSYILVEMPLTDDKFHQKQALLIERTAKILDVSREDAEQLLRVERRQSLRINVLRAQTKDILPKLDALGVKYSIVPWSKDALWIDSGIAAIRDDIIADSGNVYIQNAASWLPVLALNPQRGESILDMCAAPGGKTSHIAQLANNKAFITANDNSRPRLIKLQRNLERLVLKDVDYSLRDASQLTRHLEPESFDKILLDAPCSGEGMMNLDRRKDFESWSVAHIKRLQQLQKKLIVQAWQLLKPGGTLVYSTCTMAPEENEAVVDYLLRHNDDIEVQSLEIDNLELINRVSSVLEWNDKTYSGELKEAVRLAPNAQIEAFFVVKLTKSTAHS